MHLTIDFETRSRASLKDCGPWKYAEDPSTEVLVLAVKVDGQPAVPYIPPYWDLHWQGHRLTREAVQYAISHADTIEAHNAEFESAVWHHVLHRSLGWPDLPADKVRCSAARAASCSLPRALGQVAKVLGLPIQKDEDGHSIMMKMCAPIVRRRKVLGEYIVTHHWHEVTADYEALVRYCLTDVDTEYALSQALPALPPSELAIWQLDQRMNRRGVRVDAASCEAWMKEIAAAEPDLEEEWRRLTRGGVDSPKQVVEARDYINREFGLDIEDFRKDTLTDLLAELTAEGEEIL